MNLGSLSPAFPWSSESGKDPFYQSIKSPKLRSTPSKFSFSGFSLPSDDSSSSFSASSLSSSAAFWTTPTPPRWSISRIWSSRAYSLIRKKLAALFLITWIIILLAIPSPRPFRHNDAKATSPQAAGSPYQLLQPTLISSSKHAPNPGKWLERNSNNRFASQSGWGWSFPNEHPQSLEQR